MFGNEKRPVTSKEIGSLIGSGTTIAGDVTFQGGLRIDGVVKGAVRCSEGEKSGMLVISEQGAVEGEVRAAHLVVAGRIAGPVHVSQLLELQPKARINGDLHYRALEMHHGAIVEGTLYHHGEGKPPTALSGLAPVPQRAYRASKPSGTSGRLSWPMAKSVSLRAIVASPRMDSRLLHSGPGSRAMSSGLIPASAPLIETPAEARLWLITVATSGMPLSLPETVGMLASFRAERPVPPPRTDERPTLQ